MKQFYINFLIYFVIGVISSLSFMAFTHMGASFLVSTIGVIIEAGIISAVRILIQKLTTAK